MDIGTITEFVPARGAAWREGDAAACTLAELARVTSLPLRRDVVYEAIGGV